MNETELWDALSDAEADMRQAKHTARDLLKRSDLTAYQREVLGRLEHYASEAAFEASCLRPDETRTPAESSSS